MKKTTPATILILFLLLPLGTVYGQESEVYVDELLNRYMELENSIIENQSLTESDITDIDNLINTAINENRRDIISRARMLKFIAESSINKNRTVQNSTEITASLLLAEKDRINSGRTEKLIKSLTTADLWVAGVSTVVFAASAAGYEHFFNKYTETEYNDQAAFYLFWWQLLEDTSIISGITAVTTLLTAGILSAVF